MNETSIDTTSVPEELSVVVLELPLGVSVTATPDTSGASAGKPGNDVPPKPGRDTQ
jgi:hypothetical protein